MIKVGGDDEIRLCNGSTDVINISLVKVILALNKDTICILTANDSRSASLS